MKCRRGAALVVLGLLAATAPAPATAAEAPPPAVVESVVTDGSNLELQVRALDLPPGKPDAGAVELRLDGQPVEAQVSTVVQDRANTRRRAAIVIDTSGSMQGEPIEAARRAALRYLELVPADVEVGLVTFASQAQVLVPPTLDRDAVRAAASGLSADGRTSLYDALLLASEALGPDGQRRLLVLSDGEDSNSTAGAEQALAAVAKPALAVDAVILGDQPATEASLQRFTSAGAGFLLRAPETSQASSAFSSAATAFTSGLLVRAVVPDELAGQPVEIRVYVRTGKGLASGEAEAVMPATGSGLLAGPLALAVGLAATFAGLLGLLVLAVRGGDSVAVGRRRTVEVLQAYSLLRRPTAGSAGQPSSRVGDSAAARGLLGLAEAALRRRGGGEALQLRLERAGMQFTTGEWLVVQGVISAVALLVGALLGGLVAAVLAGLSAAAGVHLYLSLRAGRRQKAFTEAVPDALQLIASGLASGYSLPQALDAVVNEGVEPLAAEFGRALAEARVGVPLEDALDKVADRMDSEDFRWVVMAVRVQRDVGGNLSEVLTTITATMRDRAALRRQVRALSAEGRLGAVILVSLPILVALYLATFSNEFFQPMLVTTTGHVLLAGSAVSLVLGALWMKKIVKVEM